MNVICTWLSKKYIPVDFSSETNVELSSEINVVDWWLSINIVDILFSSELIMKSKKQIYETRSY